jgi:hypothetical protein
MTNDEYQFWCDGYKGFVQNAMEVVRLSGGGCSLIEFIATLPTESSDFEDEKWNAGHCNKCFERAWNRRTSARTEQRLKELMEFFFCNYVSRPQEIKEMMIGGICGVCEALERGNHENAA